MHLDNPIGFLCLVGISLVSLVVIKSDGPCQSPSTSGKVEMTVKIESRIGTPLLSDGIAYFGTQMGTFYAMDVQTGGLKWRYETQAPLLNQPVVSDGVVYVGGQDGFLHALDAQTGVLRWRFEAGRVDFEVRDKFINGMPTIHQGIAYFSSEDFNLYAVDIKTGQEIWRYTLGEEPQALQLPIVDGIAYIGSWDGYLYAIDIQTGKLVWRSETDNDHIGQTFRDQTGQLRWKSVNPEGETLSNQAPYVTVVPIITDDSVYFTDWSGNLLAVDIKTGRQRWRFKPQTINARHVGSRAYMTLFDDIVYYTTLEDKHAYGVECHTGEKVWEFTADGWLYGPIPGAGHIAFLGEVRLSDEETPFGFLIHAIDLQSKRILWTKDNFSSHPFVRSNIVYHGGLDGTLHGLDIKTGEEVWRLGD